MKAGSKEYVPKNLKYNLPYLCSHQEAEVANKLIKEALKELVFYCFSAGLDAPDYKSHVRKEFQVVPNTLKNWKVNGRRAMHAIMHVLTTDNKGASATKLLEALKANWKVLWSRSLTYESRLRTPETYAKYECFKAIRFLCKGDRMFLTNFNKYKETR